MVDPWRNMENLWIIHSTRFLAVEPLGLMGSLEVFQLHRKPGLMNFADTEPEEIYPESVKNEHQ
jgi:hypothetical protein